MYTNLNSPTEGEAFRQFYHSDEAFFAPDAKQTEPLLESENRAAVENKEEKREALKKPRQLKGTSNTAKINALFASKVSGKENKGLTKDNPVFEEELSQKIRQEKHLRQTRQAKKEKFIAQLQKAPLPADRFKKNLDKIKQVDINRLDFQA